MKRLTDSEKRMITSCFTYGQLDLENQYLDTIVDRVGAIVVTEYIEKLKSMYTIKYNVHTDYEGCTYNSLQKIKKSK